MDLERLLRSLIDTRRASEVRVELLEMSIFVERYLLVPTAQTRLDLEVVLSRNRLFRKSSKKKLLHFRILKWSIFSYFFNFDASKQKSSLS